MSTPTTPIQPAPGTRPIDDRGNVSPEFQRWFNSIVVATQQVATNTTAVTGHSATLATITTQVAALQGGANATLGGPNKFTGVNTFKLAPVFSDQAGTRYALGLGSAATYPASAFAAAGTAGTSLTIQHNGVLNSSQTLLNLAAGSNVTLTEAAGTVTIAAASGVTAASWDSLQVTWGAPSAGYNTYTWG